MVDLLLFACSASLKKILKSHIRSMNLKFRDRQRMRGPSLIRPLDGRRQLSRLRFVSAACSYLSDYTWHLGLTATQELQQVGSKSEAQRCLRLCNRRLDRVRERGTEFLIPCTSPCGSRVSAALRQAVSHLPTQKFHPCDCCWTALPAHWLSEWLTASSHLSAPWTGSRIGNSLNGNAFFPLPSSSLSCLFSEPLCASITVFEHQALGTFGGPNQPCGKALVSFLWCATTDCDSWKLSYHAKFTLMLFSSDNAFPLLQGCVSNRCCHPFVMSQRALSPLPG